MPKVKPSVDVELPGWSSSSAATSASPMTSLEVDVGGRQHYVSYPTRQSSPGWGWTILYINRWLVLSSALLLNVANYSGWISFASVTSKAADYYRVSDSSIQLIVSVSYALGTPCCAAATLVFTKVIISDVSA